MDVATIDADGFLQITDRSKDVIKSGGEWISSTDVENIAMAHPAVQMAACIGVHHPKWKERPVVVVVRKPGAEVTRQALLRFYEGRIAKWQIPDDVVFLDAIPLGATGKMLKAKLREQLAGYSLPSLRGAVCRLTSRPAAPPRARSLWLAVQAPVQATARRGCGTVPRERAGIRAGLALRASRRPDE